MKRLLVIGIMLILSGFILIARKIRYEEIIMNKYDILTGMLLGGGLMLIFVLILIAYEKKDWSK